MVCNLAPYADYSHAIASEGQGADSSTFRDGAAGSRDGHDDPPTTTGQQFVDRCASQRDSHLVRKLSVTCVRGDKGTGARNGNELLPPKQRMCGTLDRTQFDSFLFTSKHDMLHAHLVLRSAERSVHVDPVDFDDTVLRFLCQGFLVLVRQYTAWSSQRPPGLRVVVRRLGSARRCLRR
jgi:hypothetical protein